jgi:hypothetical protein
VGADGTHLVDFKVNLWFIRNGFELVTFFENDVVGRVQHTDNEVIAVGNAMKDMSLFMK